MNSEGKILFEGDEHRFVGVEHRFAVDEHRFVACEQKISLEGRKFSIGEHTKRQKEEEKSHATLSDYTSFCPKKRYVLGNLHQKAQDLLKRFSTNNQP